MTREGARRRSTRKRPRSHPRPRARSMCCCMRLSRARFCCFSFLLQRARLGHNARLLRARNRRSGTAAHITLRQRGLAHWPPQMRGRLLLRSAGERGASSASPLWRAPPGSNTTHQAFAAEALHVVVALGNTQPRVLGGLAALCKAQPKTVAVRRAAERASARGHGRKKSKERGTRLQRRIIKRTAGLTRFPGNAEANSFGMR